MTHQPDKQIFDAFRLLIGPMDNNDVRLIKESIGDLDQTGEDHSLFRTLGLLDDDDTITPYEFETLKQAIVSYQGRSIVNKTPVGEPEPETPFVDPDALRYGSSLKSMMTVKVMKEILSHEALVLEAYKDSRRIWTWGVGVTDMSGHSVRRYKDNPQSIQKVIEVYVWLLMEKYAPAVIRAFEGVTLTEYEFAAALSFHYNTGAILRADWVKEFLKGQKSAARISFMNWRKPPEIEERREAERDLFFDGKWTSDGKTTIYQVRKPGYSPKWSSARRVDVTAELIRALQS